MKNQYLVAWFARLDAAIQKAQASGKGDLELESFLASYLVVLISGAYEDCVEYLLGERAAKANDPELRKYVQVTLDRSFRNPTFKRVKEILGDFSSSYAEEFEKSVHGRAREAMNSIVNNRLSVSHGKPCTVTLGDVQGYHESAKTVFDALEGILA